MKNSKILLLLFLFALTISCDNDDNAINNNPGQNTNAFAEFFGSEISRDFLGTVIDKNQNPIENAMVSIGSITAFTDANGIFIIRNATVNERFGYVKVEKTGYLHGSRAVVPSSGTNKVTIMLLDETVVGTTASGTSETISLTNGASVALEGDYINQDGSTYSGSVNVIMHHLDPADETMQMQMPGMLYAANAQNEERMLQTFGMLAVELKGSSGEQLNLAAGSPAEITVPLDASLVANAPSTIPLWHFDNEKGYWIEDGEATLVGNAYVGTVSHFSFWNCDIPAEAVNLCVTVSDENDNLLSNLNVTITSTTYGTRGGSTNENGEVCGLVPSNETLEINVYNREFCGSSSLYTASIGPFSSDSAIDITVNNNTDIIAETVIGTFNSCDGNPVTDGYVQLGYGDQQFLDIVTNGDFEINLLRCSNNNTFGMEAADYVNLQATDSISYTFTTPLTNIGTITSCNAVTEFIQYNIDNGASEELIIDGNSISANFSTSNPNTNVPSLTIYGNTTGTNDCFYIFGQLNDPNYTGTYDYLDWNDLNDTGFNITECIDISDTNNSITYNLTTLGNVGEYIDINFSGDYEDSQANPHTITGVIHVLRDQ